MAEVLEAMGFPSEWCERALKSASGLETAVDLLLQWQAQGMPQYNLSSSSRPSSSPPGSPTSGAEAGKSVQQPNSQSGPSVAPTLRLQPLYPSASSKAAVVDGLVESPSSTLPSTPSPFPSSVDGPSGVNHPCDSDDPSSSFMADVGLRRNGGAAARIGAPESNPTAGSSRMTATGNSVVEGVSRAAPGAGSSRTVYSVDNSDAVVPDAFAEERKARYAAARRAKQEKEEDKARIRQHMQEDMANRRFRSNFMSAPEEDRSKASLPSVEQRGGAGSSSRAVSKDTAVELQIRCPGNQNLKATFTAGASLKDVRAFVKRQLQQPLMVLGAQDHHSDMRRRSSPISGQSARLSSDRQAERELLQAARDNFEVQTNRILASAKSLRDSTGVPQNSTSATIYFLIPFPRQEFFTEAAMETTLAEAQLVPRGTLVVQHRQSEPEPTASVQVAAEISDSKAIISDRIIPHQSDKPEPAEVAVVDETVGTEAVVDHTVPHFEQENTIFDPSVRETTKSGRTLELDGERVRVRELALQAAAKRMSEAAKIFRAGLPLVEGETGEAFHFPRDVENQSAASDFHGNSPDETAPAVVASVPLPADTASMRLRAAGADAEPLDASSPTDEHPFRRDGRPDGWRTEGSRDALHRQTVAAAEGRMRSSQVQAAGPTLGDCQMQNPDEAESRNSENEVESYQTRARARIPQSSRLLSRPEKLQRTSISSSMNESLTSANVERPVAEGGNRPRQLPLSIGAASRAGPLEAALQRCKATSEADNKGKAIAEEQASPEAAVPSSSVQVETERSSSLRVRLEDGNVVLHTFLPETLLQAVRDSVVPEGAVASEYGFVVPFPEPHFVEGDALASTLEEVGLVPRGTIHLTKLANRGVVRQGSRMPRRRRFVEDSDDEDDRLENMIRHLREHMDGRPELSYEEMMELEESIGRVNVGVPEEVITTLPTHIVRAKVAETEPGAEGNAAAEAEPDLCIVCMADMVEGEEALSLPCVHTFHTVCIRQWLLQSTCCPTCKQALV